jgi:hypothetical protein
MMERFSRRGMAPHGHHVKKGVHSTAQRGLDGPAVHGRASLYLQDAEGTRIPYDDIWCSAVRCKLIHITHMDIRVLWEAANINIPMHDMYPSIDEACIMELRGASEPRCFSTACKNSNIRIDVYAWHKRDAIYMTVRMDPGSEAHAMKKRARLCSIFDKVCVNRLFYRRLLSIINDVVSYLEGFKDKRLMLVVSGYSMGGVMAHIASAILGRMFPNLYTKCHTFGSPKPGNDAFAAWFIDCVKENYRVTNGTDPIVYYPIDYRWCHPERVTLHFRNNLSISISYNSMPWYKRLLMARCIIRRILRAKHNRHDHGFDVYINRLWHYVRLTSYLYSVPEADMVEGPS